MRCVLRMRCRGKRDGRDASCAVEVNVGQNPGIEVQTTCVVKGGVCQQRQSGSAQRELERGRLFIQVDASPQSRRITMVTIHTRVVPRENIERRQSKWVVFDPMPGVCTICRAMCMSGHGTGMETTVQVQLWTQLEPVLAPGAWLAAAAGSATRGLRDLRLAPGTRQAFATAVLAPASW